MKLFPNKLLIYERVFKGLNYSRSCSTQPNVSSKESGLSKVEQTKELFQKAQAVCFDVDSTVIQHEGKAWIEIIYV
jgi:hypothetical protein